MYIRQVLNTGHDASLIFIFHQQARQLVDFSLKLQDVSAMSRQFVSVPARGKEVNLYIALFISLNIT